MKRLIVWILVLIPSVLHAQQDAPQVMSERLSFENPFFGEKVLSRWKFVFLDSEEVSLAGKVFADPGYFNGLKMEEMTCDFGIVGIRFYPGKGNQFLSLGWHVGYSLLSTTGNGQRFSQQDGRLILTPYPERCTLFGEKTTLWRFRYSVPVQYSYIFGKNASWRASAGAEVHWNLVNQTNSHWTIDGNHVRELIDNIRPNPVSVDLMASLTFKNFGLRFRYSPIPVFKSGYGPAYQTWNIGLLLEY